MAHYSQLDSNNIVTQVVVISDADENGTEANGIAFCQSLFGADTVWKKTSYNTHAGEHTAGGTPFRLNYGSIGDTYDETVDGFFKTSEGKPYESWVISTTTGVYSAPIDKPDDGEEYYWDEDLHQSDNTQGWLPMPDVPPPETI